MNKAATLTPGQRVLISYGKVSERPVRVGRTQGTIRRPGRVEAIQGGSAAVRLWDPTLGRYGDALKAGLACLEVAL